MENDSEITAEYVLRNRRVQFLPGAAPALPDAAQILKAFREQFAGRCDAGIRKRLMAPLLEPANPFDAKAPRRIRQEAVVIGTLLLLALALTIIFNASAVAG